MPVLPAGISDADTVGGMRLACAGAWLRDWPSEPYVRGRFFERFATTGRDSGDGEVAVARAAPPVPPALAPVSLSLLRSGLSRAPPLRVLGSEPPFGAGIDAALALPVPSLSPPRRARSRELSPALMPDAPELSAGSAPPNAAAVEAALLAPAGARR